MICPKRWWDTSPQDPLLLTPITATAAICLFSGYYLVFLSKVNLTDWMWFTGAKWLQYAINQFIDTTLVCFAFFIDIS